MARRKRDGDESPSPLVECKFRLKADAPAQLHAASADRRVADFGSAGERLAGVTAVETEAAIGSRPGWRAEARVIEGVSRVAAELELDLLPD